MRLEAAARALFILMLPLVAYLSLAPATDEVKAGFDVADFIARLVFGDERFGDKVAHFSAYAALGLAGAVGDVRVGGRRLGAFLAIVLYGALLELGQGLGVARTPDFFDGVANFLGAASGYAAAGAIGLLVRTRAAA